MVPDDFSVTRSALAVPTNPPRRSTPPAAASPKPEVVDAGTPGVPGELLVTKNVLSNASPAEEEDEE